MVLAPFRVTGVRCQVGKAKTLKPETLVIVICDLKFLFLLYFKTTRQLYRSNFHSKKYFHPPTILCLKRGQLQQE